MVNVALIVGVFATIAVLMAVFVTPSKKYCRNCQQTVKASKGFSWVIFLLLLIAGFGVGGLLYSTYFLFKRKTCTVCGGTSFGESPEQRGTGSQGQSATTNDPGGTGGAERTATDGHQEPTGSGSRSRRGSGERSPMEKMTGESSGDEGTGGGPGGRQRADDGPGAGTPEPDRCCPDCGGAVRDPDAKFCPQCGTELATTCEECDRTLSPDDRFCPGCGTARDGDGSPATGDRHPEGSEPSADRDGRDGRDERDDRAGSAGASGAGRSGTVQSSGSRPDDERDILKAEREDGSVTARCGGCRAEVRETARRCPDCGATLRNVRLVDADELR